MEKRIGINELAKIIADGEPEAHVEVLNYDDTARHGLPFQNRFGSMVGCGVADSIFSHHVVDAAWHREQTKFDCRT